MNRLNVNFCGVDFKNPIVPASGTYGYGREYECLYPLSTLGGISVKGTTLHRREGNPAPRVAETPSGMLNSVGLQNGGVDKFLSYELPNLVTKDTRIIANIAGSTIEECAELAAKLKGSDIDMIELNISCPNVKQGGAAFGTDCNIAGAVTKAVKDNSDKPVMVKLSPNVTSIVDIAKSVEANGADAVSLINTLLGMRIDINTGRPILKNNVGGLSGPAVFPVAVRMVWQVANAVNIPVCGMGGVSTWEDAVEIMMAGASLVQVGAAIFNDPFAPVKIIDGLQKFCEDKGINNISEIVGTVKPW
ncbi:MULTISPECIES: dihydroorotate dehydrogenase [Ruminococcus]|jgi:dihydroorotate dehydrogenase (NAD+) catalytic subunit|uniref:Dihydroorotate dehydrogenase n=1 Tax=Ruminococcus albus (strain ATCC 27210 / DSM 20455 / JCM 14654 / NCDO 2250 / 7) TaxID=697329 RepID=E6UIK2_RUMA7|nr:MULTISPECIES: dihydroorotate dehydrogenase [Ruminococcus]ADU23347.1 dihydroorotate dehydrogenase family protein [Ruminococcus albus 7 = DSM 20455]MBE6869022.1 dihydroorotate dehydrogenase [Ruminococcus albus]MCR5019565.1 dihydroorotate dehydrogenase [Ruminococcus sp.]